MRRVVGGECRSGDARIWQQHAIRIGNVICRASGFLIPAVGKFVAQAELDGQVRAQTDRVLRNLSEILEAAGSGLGKVVRSTVFLKNMGDFAAMNGVYGKYFSSAPPARSTVEVARLPKDVLVEIDVIALE